jgi:23S rRNA (uracil1939-C5)-methyltransferase
VKPGEVVEAAIEKGVYRGRGLGRVDGRVVFVPRAHPGDRVRVRLTAVHAGWAEGALVDLLEPAPERRASPCPYVPQCGGCAYQDLDYGAQLRVKEAVLRESLARAGSRWDGDVTVHGCRRRAGGCASSISPPREGAAAGSAAGGHAAVEIETCPALRSA